MIRLLHIGLGALGRRVLTDFCEHGVGELLAVVDTNPELVGTPVQELVPAAPAGLTVQSSLHPELESGRVTFAMVTTSSSLEVCSLVYRELLDHGVNVVSSCEELLYPWLRHPVLAQELHERGVRKDARIVGTGINPGFLMDMLPLVMTSVCTELRSIQVSRVQDASSRRVPFQQKIGAGLDLETFEQRITDGTLRHVGLGESLHFLAHYLGWDLERWEENIAPVVAEEELSSASGAIPAGHAAGVRQVARGWRAGEEVLTLEFQAAIGQADAADSLRIEGSPPIEVLVPGGVHGDHGTSAMLLHAIGALREAQPGLHTMATLRPPRFEAAR